MCCIVKNIRLVISSIALSAILLSSIISTVFAQVPNYGPHTTNYIATPWGGHYAFWMANWSPFYSDALIVINRDDLKGFIYNIRSGAPSVIDAIQMPSSLPAATMNVALVFDYYQTVVEKTRPDLLFIIKQGGASTAIHVLSGANRLHHNVCYPSFSKSLQFCHIDTTRYSLEHLVAAKLYLSKTSLFDKFYYLTKFNQGLFFPTCRTNLSQF
jgi:hypothetical protein